MRWGALPVAGGIYDQHPKLLREWMIIFNEKAEHEKKEARKRDQKARSGRSRRR
jgi:hypothetical protein